MVGKPRYDEQAVMQAATALFRRHGYAGTSIGDLTEATGLSRSSLYQRFRDKDGLFVEALSSYTARVLERMNEVRGQTQRDRLEALLREFAPRDETRPPAACLLARCCADMDHLPQAAKRAALHGLMRQHQLIEGILHRALSDGELTAGTDIDSLAWHYLGVLQAVLTLPQAGATPRAVRNMIQIAMSAWPAAGGRRPRK